MERTNRKKNIKWSSGNIVLQQLPEEEIRLNGTEIAIKEISEGI